MGDWSLTADDLYAGVMVVDLALARLGALSGDFEHYSAVGQLSQLRTPNWFTFKVKR